MKITKDYFLREVAGSYIAVPAGSLVREDPNVLDMNESGAFLFKLLQKGIEEPELTKALAEKFNLEETKAAADVNMFLQLLRDHHLIQE